MRAWATADVPMSKAGKESAQMPKAMKPITRIAHGKPLEAVMRSKAIMYATPPEKGGVLV